MPGLEAADLVLLADRVGRVGRGGVDGLLDAHPQSEDAELEDEEHRFEVIELPGLKSEARATTAPASMSLRAGARLSCIRKNGTPGRRIAAVALPARACDPRSR